MKARPILMSAPMVRALLEGRKTQTRRTAKIRHEDCLPSELQEDLEIRGYNCHEQQDGIWLVTPPCPYGQPGDVLWVRETAYVQSAGYMDGSGKIIVYRADDPHAPVGGWTPSIHMYRFASRLTLELTAVRAERLQDCSEADALAEGAEPDKPYGTIWKAINGQASWDANPWVWALTFKVHQQNVDAFLRARAA